MQLGQRLRAHGTYRGWWIVSALFLASALTVGSSQYAFGLFLDPLETTFGWSRTQISASLSFAAVGGVMAPFLGRFMDRYGARPIMAVSISAIALSYLLRPLMTELWHWYALSILQYLGFTGSAMLPAGRLIGIWFSKTRGRVMGLTMMGNNFGGLVFPPIVGVVLTATSWQGSYIVLGGISLLIMLFAMSVVREYPTGDDLPDAEADSSPSGNGASSSTMLSGWTASEALHSKTFYIVAISILLGTFTYSAILPQVVAHLTNEGVSVGVASIALSTLAIGGMLGKIAFGYLAERITTRYALMIDLIGQATFVSLMTFASFQPIMWISVPLFGFCMGAFGALFTLIVQDTFGIRSFGSIMGLINFTTVVSLSVGPILAGLSFDITGSYSTAFYIVAGLFLLSALLLTQARPQRTD